MNSQQKMKSMKFHWMIFSWFPRQDDNVHSNLQSRTKSLVEQWLNECSCGHALLAYKYIKIYKGIQIRLPFRPTSMICEDWYISTRHIRNYRKHLLLSTSLALFLCSSNFWRSISLSLTITQTGWRWFLTKLLQKFNRSCQSFET